MPLNNAGKTLCIYRGMKKLAQCVYTPFSDYIQWLSDNDLNIDTIADSRLGKNVVAFRVDDIEINHDSVAYNLQLAKQIMSSIEGIRYKRVRFNDVTITEIDTVITKQEIATLLQDPDNNIVIDSGSNYNDFGLMISRPDDRDLYLSVFFLFKTESPNDKYAFIEVYPDGTRPWVDPVFGVSDICMKKLNDQVYLFDNQQLTGSLYPTSMQTGLVPNGTESGDYITVRRVRGHYIEQS